MGRTTYQFPQILNQAMPNSTKTELQEEVCHLRHRVKELERQLQLKVDPSVKNLAGEVPSERRRYRDPSLFDSIPCGILQCDASGKIQFGNASFLKMHGYQSSDLAGMSIYDLLVEERERVRLQDDLSCLINCPIVPLSRETRHQTKDGKTIAVQVDWNCQQGESDTENALFAVITNPRESEPNHSQGIDQALQYFNLTGEMMIAIDADETVTLINQQGTKLLERDESDIVGKNWFDHFLPTSSREEVRTLFRQLMRGEMKPVEYYQNEVLTGEGKLKSVAWHNSILRDHAGSIIGTFSVGVDISEDKETQQALRENSQLFRQISEHVRGLFWVCSPDFSKTFYLSQMYEEIWGRSCQSAYDDPSTWFEGIHPDDRKAVLEDLERKSRGDFTNPDFPICRIVHTDGTIRWILSRAFPIYNDHNQVIRIVGMVEDITQRKLEEDAFHKENEELERRVEERTAELASKTAQLKAMFNAIPDVVLVINTQGNIVKFNSRHKKNIFDSHDLAIDRKIWDVLPHEVGKKFEAAIQKVITTKNMETIDYSLVIEEDAIWYRARVLPYQLDEVLVIIEYIHDQKLAEIELKNTHEKLSEAQRLAHIGSWDWDIKHDVLWWSDEVFHIFGLSQSKFTPTYESFLECVLSDDRKLVKNVVEQAIKYDVPYNIEHRILRPDGKIRYVQEQGALKKNARGEILHMHGTIQDITERHETARKTQEYRDILAHASRLAVMGELTAGISHELNQPLTAIANYSSVMKIYIEQGRDVFELVSRIEELSLRSGKIVRRLKSLAERRAQEFVLFDLHDSIRNTLQLIKYEIRQKQIEVNIISDLKIAMVYADRIQIEQVLTNLFLNAVEAMLETVFPRILAITISSAEDHTISVAVSDTGKGVPADFTGQLFTPFTSTKKDGLGIGLSLSRSLVESTGGTICYQPSDCGATFQVTLPTSKIH